MSHPHIYNQPLHHPIVGSVGPLQNVPPSVPAQFRPGIPAHPTQQYIPSSSQQYQPGAPTGPAINVGLLAPNSQQPQFRPLIQQPPARPVGPTLIPPLLHVSALQENRPLATGVLPPPNVLASHSYLPNSGNPGTVVPSSHDFIYGVSQTSKNIAPHYQSVHQINHPTISAGEDGKVSSENTVLVTHPPSTGQEAPVSANINPAANFQPKPVKKSSSIWMVHTKADGRRYYYNKKTKLSSWEKPFELMTEIERADATTDWKEYISPVGGKYEGRKYYYNKVTKQSKWRIPEELKLAREQAKKASPIDTKIEAGSFPVASDSISFPAVEVPSTHDSSSRLVSSPMPEVPLNPVTVPASPNAAANGLLPCTIKESGLQSDAADVQPPTEGVSGSVAESVVDVTAASADLARSDVISVSANEAVTPVAVSEQNDSVQLPEEADKEKVSATENVAASEETSTEECPVVYPSKLEAKNAFKELLESANIESDWTWEQAMRVIINDKRYCALKSLAERKQTFNEFLSQRKKQDAEERRAKQKKAREEFRRMLQECSELTSGTRWSKAVNMFGEDERFKAVERYRDREDIFEDYMSELEKKESTKAAEEHKRNIVEFRQFLESCNFIKASSQWRKVQDRLEVDERCMRLEKIDRLEIFQEYVRDLEKQEEEQRKIQKEEIRKSERKNRDEFRKLMEEHIAAGILTAKSNWREFHSKVKDEPAYLAVSSNSSGFTPKELFEDVVEELQQQFEEDRSRIKDALKLEKIIMRSTWKLQDMKDAIEKEINSKAISETNMQIVFDELIERAKEKEEKEAKKLKRLGDEFFNFLCSLKDITAYSKWDEALPLFEHSEEYRSITDEVILRQIFDEYTGQLREKYERKRKEEKARKEREREKEKNSRERKRKARRHERHSKKDRYEKDNADDGIELSVSSDSRRLGKEKDKKHLKWNENVEDDIESDGNGKEYFGSSHRQGDRKKSRQDHGIPDFDNENRRKKRKRQYRKPLQKRAGSEELEDGEVEIL